MNKRTTVGIDLAKAVFAIRERDAHGAVVERRDLRRTTFERWAESPIASGHRKAAARLEVDRDSECIGGFVELDCSNRPRHRDPQNLLEQSLAHHRLLTGPSPITRPTRPCASVFSCVPRQGRAAPGRIPRGPPLTRSARQKTHSKLKKDAHIVVPYTQLENSSGMPFSFSQS